MLSKLGIKDTYKHLMLVDSGFIYYMYLEKEHYDFNACHRWVIKKEVNDDGRVFSFLSTRRGVCQ
jgi:hypothetical protein